MIIETLIIGFFVTVVVSLYFTDRIHKRGLSIDDDMSKNLDTIRSNLPDKASVEFWRDLAMNGDSYQREKATLWLKKHNL